MKRVSGFVAIGLLVLIIGGCFQLDQKMVNSEELSFILNEDGSISIKALKELTGIDMIIAASIKEEAITIDDSLLKIVTHSDEYTTRIAIVSTSTNIIEGEEIAKINGNFTTLKNLVVSSSAKYLEMPSPKPQAKPPFPDGVSIVDGSIDKASEGYFLVHAENVNGFAGVEITITYDPQYIIIDKSKGEQGVNLLNSFGTGLLIVQHTENTITITSAFNTERSVESEDIYQIHFMANPVEGKTLIETAFAKNQNFYILLLRSARYSPQRLCHFETLVQAGICQIETLDATLISHFDTLVDNLNCHFETLVSADICQFETIIKILFKLKDTGFFLEDNQLPDTTFSADNLDINNYQVGGKDISYNIGIAAIFDRINPILRLQIQERHAENNLLSWLVFGSLTPEIRNPLSFAVSRTLETGIDAGGPAARLALLPTQELASLLLRTQKRIESGYLGWSQLAEAGAEDLNALLRSVTDSQTQLHLLQRLMDNLEVKVKS